MRARSHGWALAAMLATGAAVGAPADARGGRDGEVGDSCLVVREIGGKDLIREGAPGCEAEALSPCSTYKVPHALIGLDAGVLSGPGATYAWDGSDQYFDSWERDHDLGSALEHSVVWYFQRLAADLGEERTQAYLDRLDYGNRDLSGGLTTYWLDSSLTVSVDQQLAFLEQLYRDALPVSPGAMATVRELIVYEQGPGWAVSGKTGTCRPDDAPGHGWYVGHLRSAERELVFASWQRGDGDPGGRDVRHDLLARLSTEGWLPEGPPPGKGPRPSGDEYGAAVGPVVQHHQADLRRCYEAASPDDLAASGGCAVRFVIGAGGAVTAVDLGACEAPLPLQDCLRQVIGGMHFPAPEGGGEVRVSYPINVDPVPDAEPDP